MERIESYEEWIEVARKLDSILLFVKTDNCSVCDGLLPQVAALQSDYSVPFYLVNVADTPEIAGQLSLFTAPVVLLYREGKEYARFARFVQMNELKKRLGELEEEWGKQVD
ncbi:thioredoxin family protein [Sporosarcina sp. Marseille-Q4063]|uniref:thioredoxin family protein n=1 Tax=Sporosarcina sp. Marseille-Q4063 TaxID=2810514 RepID=UPI001BAF42E5|nr:thioredoxin family protein [Sporosarcina sp. Marseille-Q4063]QUW22322.1 thioredoxin family protein [Sporosarcina sp. Marseille-Q4063]